MPLVTLEQLMTPSKNLSNGRKIRFITYFGWVQGEIISSVGQAGKDNVDFWIVEISAAGQKLLKKLGLPATSSHGDIFPKMRGGYYWIQFWFANELDRIYFPIIFSEE